MENKNTFYFDKNIIIKKEAPEIEQVFNYLYEHKEGDELVFSDSLEDAFGGFVSESREGIKKLYGGSFPKDLVPEPKDGYDYFVYGMVWEDGHRKFYVYPDKFVKL